MEPVSNNRLDILKIWLTTAEYAVMRERGRMYKFTYDPRECRRRRRRRRMNGHSKPKIFR